MVLHLIMNGTGEIQVLISSECEFSSSFRNLPESTIEGRIATKDRVQYHFTAIRSTVLVLIEVKFKIGNAKERLDAVAQIIAECDGQACS